MSLKNSIPDGYTAVTPYLIVADTLNLLDYLSKALGAKEVRRTPAPSGPPFNIEVRIGDAMIMLVQARARHPKRPADLYHYVNDVDQVYKQAITAGGTSLMEPEDVFYGERQAGIEDPAGNRWWISARTEELTTEELAERAAQR
jgi:uncharacterized glyoxalase superfamily protein PhnB